MLVPLKIPKLHKRRTSHKQKRGCKRHKLREKKKQRLHQFKKYNQEEERSQFNLLLFWKNPNPQKGKKQKSSGPLKFPGAVAEDLDREMLSKMMTLL
jgi:hypothetical protein